MKSKFLKGLYLLIVSVVGFFLAETGDFGSVGSTVVKPQYTGDTVSVLSVGQANSCLISTAGEYCLIDAGYTNTGHTDTVSYLRSMGVKEIELVVVTHFHSDHTSDIIDVMKSFDINNMVIPKLTKENMPTASFFSLFLDMVERNNINLIPAEKGDEYTVGDGTVTILDDTYNDLTINDTSVATLFRQGDFTFLNTADGEEEYEKRLLKVFDEKVTLFTAGHHGSSTSNTKKFIKTIKPDFVAISAGRANDYGHPHKSVTQLLEKEGIPYGVTFRDGTIVYSITENRLLTDTGD